MIFLIIWAIGAVLWTLIVTQVYNRVEDWGNPEMVQYSEDHPKVLLAVIVFSGIFWFLSFPYGIYNAMRKNA